MVTTHSEYKTKKEGEKRFEDNHSYGFVLKDFTDGRRFYNSCKRFSNFHGVSTPDFEDIYQGFMIRAELDNSHDPSKGKESTYFFAVFKNNFLDFIRKRSKDKLINLTSLEGRSIDLDTLSEKNRFYYNNTPINLLINQESYERTNELIYSNIQKLNPLHYKILFRLLSEQSYNEISEGENICIGSVKSRLYVAKKRLKEKINTDALAKGFNIEETLF